MRDPNDPDASERRPIPGELEAADEFETAPPGTPTSGPAAGQPGSGTPPAPTGVPSAAESFERQPSRESAASAGAPGASGTDPTNSVPATTSVGQSTLCPRCGTENRPGVAFCRQCGQRLVAPGAATVERPTAPEGMQTCPRCGTLNRAGMPFCQNCGANLRPAAAPAGTAGTAGATDRGYESQPTYAPTPRPAAVPRPDPHAGGAVLGPLVLLIGAVGLSVAWLLPFAYDTGSLFARSFGSASGYQFAFWDAIPDVGDRLADQAYFALAAAVPVLVFLLVLLAIGGFVRARPGPFQIIGLLLAFLWAAGLGGLFVVVEVLGANTTELTDLLRSLTPAGIIFLLSSLIVLIGLLTRFARS